MLRNLFHGRSAGPRAARRLEYCLYHSFPDPNEKPIISTARSDNKKNVEKTNNQTSINRNFRMDVQFPIPSDGRTTASLSHQTLSTKLESGLTVSSQDLHSMMTSFAFIVKTGSSFERQSGTNTNTGATHLLELNAFRGTSNRSRQQLLADVENMGGMVQCISTRENFLFCVDVLRENAEQALDVLAETVLAPVITDEDMEETKMMVAFQRESMAAEILSRDAAQMAGFHGSPLGNHHYCPDETSSSLNINHLNSFRSEHFYGENCFISATGIEHSRFVHMVESRFASLPKIGTTGSGQRPKSVYTGGLFKNERVLKEPFVKIAIGYEIGGWRDPKLVTGCVMQQLLGGGSSFSAGGPGKGMYTRLYRDVLNRNYWVESAEAFITVHDEAGMLGIDGACEPAFIQNLIQVIVDQLTLLAVEPVTTEELSRAKKMLKSMMMMQLESRLVQCEDIARQMVTYGHRESHQEICAKIDAVTKEDLMLLARRMLTSPPSVGCVGHDLSHVPSYDAIKDFAERYKVKAFSKFDVKLT